MLTELTEEQRELMNTVRDEWLDRMFARTSVEIDMETLHAEIEWLYGLCGYPKPAIVVVDSPMAAQYAVHEMTAPADPGDKPRELEYVAPSWYGSVLDFGWVSFYDFFSRIGIVNNPQFDHYKRLMSCGLYDTIQLEGLCVVTRMPTTICRDAENRLHRENGKAIEWADGYGLSFWHGVPVPDRLLTHPHEITKEDILENTNAEVRRAFMEVLSPEKFATLLGVTEVDHDTCHGETVRLLRSEKPDTIIGDHLQFAHVTCPSTGREYFLCVPPDLKNAWEAVAWTFNREPDTYFPEHHT